MRRQAANSRVTPAGSGRVERLDPFALPLRFHDVDETADQRVRLVELHRERVVLRRTLRGIEDGRQPGGFRLSGRGHPARAKRAQVIPQVLVQVIARDSRCARAPRPGAVAHALSCAGRQRHCRPMAVLGARVRGPPAGRGGRREPARTVRENGPAEHRNPVVAASKPNCPFFATLIHGAAARTRCNGARSRRAQRARDHRPQLRTQAPPLNPSCRSRQCRLQRERGKKNKPGIPVRFEKSKTYDGIINAAVEIKHHRRRPSGCRQGGHDFLNRIYN